MSTGKIVSLLAQADIGVYAVSLDQRIVFWNRGAERILGYTAEQVVGRHCYEVVSGVTPGGLTPACQEGCPSLRALQAGSVPRAVEMQLLSISGERKTVPLTTMVVSGAIRDMPIIVHLFESGDWAADGDRAATDVRHELTGSGVDIFSDRAAAAASVAATDTLTPRELEVLRLVSLSRTTDEIATELGISAHTVRNHVRHFRRKLGAATKLEAVLTALRQGVLDWN